MIAAAKNGKHWECAGERRISRRRELDWSLRSSAVSLAQVALKKEGKMENGPFSQSCCFLFFSPPWGPAVAMAILPPRARSRPILRRRHHPGCNPQPSELTE